MRIIPRTRPSVPMPDDINPICENGRSGETPEDRRTGHRSPKIRHRLSAGYDPYHKQDGKPQQAAEHHKRLSRKRPEHIAPEQFRKRPCGSARGAWHAKQALHRAQRNTKHMGQRHARGNNHRRQKHARRVRGRKPSERGTQLSCRNIRHEAGVSAAGGSAAGGSAATGAAAP